MGTSDTLLTSSNVTSSVTPLLTRAAEFLADARLGASPLQLEHFVIGEGGDNHPWGMYQQALREITTRSDSIKSLLHDIQVLQCEEQRYRMRAARYAFTRFQRIDRQEHELKAERARSQIVTLSVSYNDLTRELAFLLTRARCLRDQLPVALTDEVVKKLDEDYWLRRLTRVATTSLVQTGTLDPTLIRLLMAHSPFSAKLLEALPALPQSVSRYIDGDAQNHPRAAIAGR